MAVILMGGSEQLMAERQDSAEGAAKESAVLAALRLIRAAFDKDQAAVAFLRQSELSGTPFPSHHIPSPCETRAAALDHQQAHTRILHKGDQPIKGKWDCSMMADSALERQLVACAGFDTLDGLIRRDRRWLPSLLDYVSYTPNPALQVEAAKIAAILVDRLPHFPDLLMQPLGSGEYAISTYPDHLPSPHA